MSDKNICKFFQSSSGCQNGDKCRWVHMAPNQSNTASLLGVMGTETIEIPATDSAVIVGKKGSTIKHLRTACGEAQVDLPEFKKDRKSYPLTITADLGVLQALIVEITNVLLNNNREITYLIPYLKKYELFAFIEYLQMNGQIKRESTDFVEERPSKRPTLLSDEGYPNTGMTGEYGSNFMHESGSMQGDINMIGSVGMQSNMMQGAGVETDYGQGTGGMNAMMGSSGMSSMNSGSGWGPMIDESKAVANIPIPNVEDTLDIIKEVGNKGGILPNKKEFLYLSQHVVTDAFTPSVSSHPKSMKTKPQEIVTFVQQCSCTLNCGYALFRNAVDESGYLPLQIISDEILKFECAYCDDVNEFYQEKEYLTHAVLVHFWRRISSFLDDGISPYTCPVGDCGKQFLTFKTLVLHYGGIPHKKVGALILDSVGERVKNVREVSKGQVDKSGELEKAKRYIEELKQKNANLELSKQTSSASIQSLGTVQKQLIESKTEVASLTKQKEVIQKLKLQVEQDLKKKEIALKNSQDALTSNLKKINGLKNDVQIKTDLIKELQKTVASKSSSSSKNGIQTAENKAETDKLKKEIARLKQIIKDKDEQIGTLEATSGGNAGGSNALIEKLKKTIKSQKNMLQLKQKEIELIKEGMDAEDDGIIDLD